MSWEDHAEQILDVDAFEFDKDEWLAARRTGMGGSDARVLMGHGYADESQFSMLRSKLVALPERPDNIRFRRGNHAEVFIAEEFHRWQIENHEFDVHRPLRTGTWRNKERPWQLANPDWRVGQKGMESKNVDNYGSAKAYREMEGIPPRFYWQCLAYMDALGAEGWWLCIDSPFYDQLEVRYLDLNDVEPDLLLLRERAGNFWTTHVVNGFELFDEGEAVEPTSEPDPEATVEATFPEAVLDALEEWRQLKFPGTKAGKARINEIKELLTSQIGPVAKTLTIDGVPVLRWQGRKNPDQIDWAGMEEKYPGAKAEFTIPGSRAWHLAEITTRGNE